MMKMKYFLFSLICMICSCVVFAANEVVIKSITPVFDEESTIVLNEDNSVVFNDKDQSVEYKVVLENTTDKDLPIEDISLNKPSEDFLIYELEGLKKDDVLKANSEHEVIVSLSTVKIDGWGRNFNDELTANINIDSSVLNPNTSTMGIVIILVIVTFFTAILITTVKSKKISRYVALIVMFGSLVSVTKAKESLVLPIKINASYESQNVIKKAYELTGGNFKYNDFWGNFTITNVFIENDIREIEDYAYKYDISNDNNGKVLAYLVKNGTTVNNPYDSFDPYTQFTAYDLYIMADGLIYMNSDSSYFFANMYHIKDISNLSGLDTSNVIKMAHMFEYVGSDYGKSFTLDLSSFDTSKVTDMSYMFSKIGYGSDSLSINLGSFDTSNVTDMSYMFSNAGYNSEIIDIDFSKFNTRNVTNMSGMFMGFYYRVKQASFDFSNFDTSKVTDMSSMFYAFGETLEILDIDLTSFDTTNVTDMSEMFRVFGLSAEKVVLDLSSFDTSNVVDMSSMFYQTADFASSFDLNLGDLELDSVMDTSSLFCNFGYKLPLVFSINIVNPNTTNYSRMFNLSAAHVDSKITVNYTKETEELVDKMIATKSNNSNVVKGMLFANVDNLSIGDEVQIENEMFNVISQTDDTVTMLAQYNLDKNFKQNVQSNTVVFSDGYGWEYTPGPKEVDIQLWSVEPKMYINEYIKIINDILKVESVSGDLITLTTLKELGCTIIDDYSSYYNCSCSDTSNSNWLVNGQYWWTKSVASTVSYQLFIVADYGNIYLNDYTDAFDRKNGVRPVISVPKQALREYLKA